MQKIGNKKKIVTFVKIALIFSSCYGLKIGNKKIKVLISGYLMFKCSMMHACINSLHVLGRVSSIFWLIRSNK